MERRVVPTELARTKEPEGSPASTPDLRLGPPYRAPLWLSGSLLIFIDLNLQQNHSLSPKYHYLDFIPRKLLQTHSNSTCVLYKSHR